MENSVNGELIRNLRQRRAWSQELLADKAGVSMRTIQRMETDGVASLHSRNAVAEVFEVPAADLLAQTASTRKTGDPIDLLRSRIFLLKPVLRFGAKSALWIGMIFSLFLILATLVSGIFFWESLNMTQWESAGQGIIGAAVFVPFFILFYYLYRRVSG